MVHLRIVKAIEQMDRTRPGGGETNSDFAGELGVRAGHERRHLFVAHLNVVDRVAGAINRADDPIDPVTRVAVDALQSPFGDQFHQKIARRLIHSRSLI